jgi:hypothetical protein
VPVAVTPATLANDFFKSPNFFRKIIRQRSTQESTQSSEIEQILESLSGKFTILFSGGYFFENDLLFKLIQK